MSERYFVRTFGCQMNEHDSEKIAGLLAGSGLEAAESAEEADVLVFNTCCIRENADNKLYGNLGYAASRKAENPNLRIVVAGCLAQKDKELMAKRAPYVDLIVGTFNLSRIPELLSEERGEGPRVEVWERAQSLDSFDLGLAAKRESTHIAWVTIQSGCDNKCAFCIVPSVRGVESSRPFGSVVDEVRQLARAGVTEVTLLGQNVNSYGRDLTVAARSGALEGDPSSWLSPQYLQSGGGRLRPLFADLLREVGAVKGIRRVRFTSPHPKDMRPETFEAMAETPTVAPQLHFPLQSGSDRILARMHRGYTAERYLAKLREARATISDLAVSSDIIVGFPGETEADFEATLSVSAEARFDGAYTFVFSPRPGTEAALMGDDFVDPEVVADRFSRLTAVIERSGLMRNEARVGLIEVTLVEGVSKRDPMMLSGRTAQNKLIHFPQPSATQPLLGGEYVDVAVTSAAPHFLRGEVVGQVIAARVRPRIAVTS